MKILSNQVRCKKCGDTPYSANVHDFRSCKCGAIAVDGGMEYLRRVGDFENAAEMSISVPDKVLYDCKAALKWAHDTGRNDLGIICAIFRVLRAHDYDLTITETENK